MGLEQGQGQGLGLELGLRSGLEPGLGLGLRLGLLGQVWVQRGPWLWEGAGLPAWVGAGGFPHCEGLHWGLCVPSALPCAVGVWGVPWLWGGCVLPLWLEWLTWPWRPGKQRCSVSGLPWCA